MKIEIELPDGIDTRQLYTHVVDAIGINDNITEEEHHALVKIMKAIKNAKQKYYVSRQVIFYQHTEVEASSEKEAIELSKSLSWFDDCAINKIEDIGRMDFYDTDCYSASPSIEDEYIVDGYENKDPFSVFHVKPFSLTRREYEMALIPDNPKSNITITKTYKKWDAQ